MICGFLFINVMSFLMGCSSCNGNVTISTSKAYYRFSQRLDTVRQIYRSDENFGKNMMKWMKT